LTNSTNNTSNTVRRMINMPNCRAPRSKLVGAGLTARLSAISPKAVAAPVRHTSIVALPLITDVPMNTEFAAVLMSSLESGPSTACFSTG